MRRKGNEMSNVFMFIGLLAALLAGMSMCCEKQERTIALSIMAVYWALMCIVEKMDKKKGE